MMKGEEISLYIFWDASFAVVLLQDILQNYRKSFLDALLQMHYCSGFRKFWKTILKMVLEKEILNFFLNTVPSIKMKQSNEKVVREEVIWSLHAVSRLTLILSVTDGKYFITVDKVAVAVIVVAFRHFWVSCQTILDIKSNDKFVVCSK